MLSHLDKKIFLKGKVAQIHTTYTHIWFTNEVSVEEQYFLTQKVK